jgi:hypothetical protein
MESKEWERFKTETKNQFMVFLKASKYGDATKHVLTDTLDGINDHALDVLATLRIIRASNNPREITVAGMLAFLWEYEGSYATCVDAFCFLLIANGHDLFDFIKRKYVKSLEDIGNVDVSTKLNFLEEHGFEIFRRTEDKNLRNKIAHHDFTLDASGRVFIDKKDVDIGSRFKELTSFTERVFETFFICLSECQQQA